MNSVFCVWIEKLALLLYVSRKQEGEITLLVKVAPFPFYWLKISFAGTLESTFCKLLELEFLNTSFKTIIKREVGSLKKGKENKGKEVLSELI